MSLLDGFRVTQIGPGLAASVCGRLLADVGAAVARIDPDRSLPLAEHLNHGHRRGPCHCRRRPDRLRRQPGDAAPQPAATRTHCAASTPAPPSC